MRLQRGRRLAPLERKVVELEGEISRLEELQRGRTAQMADDEFYADGRRAAQVTSEYQKDRERLEQLTVEWEAAQKQLDEARLIQD